MAKTARRDVIGLLIEREVNYTEAEAGALVAQAKLLAKESGRTVRAEAELLLLSRDTDNRLRDLQNQVVEASKLLAAITIEIDELRANPGHDHGDLVTIDGNHGCLLRALHVRPWSFSRGCWARLADQGRPIYRRDA